MKQETMRKAFENDMALKMTELAKTNKISVVTMSRDFKTEGRRSMRQVKKPLFSTSVHQKSVM